jgi:hypothetical protein
MRATGVANFLHVRANSLRSWKGAPRPMIRNSPVIRRRSGVEKFEVDLRRRRYPLAAAPLKLDALIFISRGSAGTGRSSTAAQVPRDGISGGESAVRREPARVARV